MTLETFSNRLKAILDDFYAGDSSWRHDPLWLKVKALQQRAQAALDAAQDAVDAEAIKARELVALLGPQHAPDNPIIFNRPGNTRPISEFFNRPTETP